MDVQGDVEKLQRVVDALVGQIEPPIQKAVSDVEGRLRAELEVVAKSVRTGQILSAIVLVGVVASVVVLLLMR